MPLILHMSCHSPDGSTFLCEMISRLPAWKYNIVSEIQLRQSMSIYLKKNPAKFHIDLICSDGALGVFWRESPNKNQNKKNNNNKNKMSSDIGSVRDPKK